VASEVKPDAIRVMKEMGIDISGQRSKDSSEFLGHRFVYVVKVCNRAKETCPIFPGAFKYFDLGLDDPAAAKGSESERLAVFRRVRDGVKGRVLEFVARES
jgi:arsenate reductase